MAHLDDLMHPIFYVTRQGGCDRFREVGDPKRFCDILGCVRKQSLMERTNLHTLTESALYSPVDDPEVFVGFGFGALIIAGTVLLAAGSTVVAVSASSGKVLGKSPPKSRHGGDAFPLHHRRRQAIHGPRQRRCCLHQSISIFLSTFVLLQVSTSLGPTPEARKALRRLYRMGAQCDAP